MDSVYTRIVSVKLPNGATMHVEAEPIGEIAAPIVQIETDVAARRLRLDDNDALPFAHIPQESDVADRTAPLSQQDIQSVMGTIEGIAQAVTTSAERSNAYEMTVEFGLKLAIENGQLTSLFVKGSGEANLKVSLKWVRQDKETTTTGGGK